MINSYRLRRLALQILRPFTQRRVYTIRRGIARGLRRRGGFGFVPPELIPVSKEEKFLAELDLEGQTVFDVGAYQGVFTMFFARAVGPQGRVFTFEPNPQNFEIIQDNLQLNGFENVKAYCMAIGRHPGTAQLFFEPREPGEGAIHLEGKTRAKGKMERIAVNLDSLDNRIKTAGIPMPDFVKIDVEGFEVQVLKGMSQTLAKARPRLFIEVHGESNSASAARSKQIYEILAPFNYSFRHVETWKELAFSENNEITGGHLFCY